MTWRDKVVSGTGETGSFGMKFIEIMLKEYRPSKNIVFRRGELILHDLQINGFSDPSLRYPERMERATLRSGYCGLCSRAESGLLC